VRLSAIRCVEEKGRWFLQWGTDGADVSDVPPTYTYTFSDEWRLAAEALRACPGARRRAGGRVWFATPASARRAARVVRTMLRLVRTGCLGSWPRWAISAVAAGWSPPKGWRP
jgi:hypothetical protein